MMYLVLTLLFFKHFLADFLYQPPYQWKNKGTYGHPGGLIHSLQHIALTALVVGWLVPWWKLLDILVIESLVHYHMDWAKMKYNAHKGWKCNEHPQFWVLLGVDQLVHSLTYIGITFITFAL